MSRVNWKNEKLLSLKLRDGSFALLQMLESRGHIAVFNIFRKEDSWNDCELKEENVLFKTLATRAFFSRSQLNVQKHAASVKGLGPTDNPKIDIGSGFREITLWQGTADERSFLMMGNGKNELRVCTHENGNIHEEYEPIVPENYDRYKRIELTNLSDYPNLNERIYLCSKFSELINPLKELAFNRQIPIEYLTYIDIIAGKMSIKELGY